MASVEVVTAEDGTVLRHDGSGVPQVSPPRFDVDDADGIRGSLKAHGFACIKEAMLPHEVTHGRELLWQFLEGDEQPLMTQSRPAGWKRGQPTTWLEGHGDHLMTSTTHIDSMWYCRTRPGVIQGFATAIGTADLTCAYDRMSINLPISTGNPEALRVAAAGYEHGKLGVAQRLHTHKNGYYDELNEEQTGKPEYCELEIKSQLFPDFSIENAEINGELPLKNDDFLLKNGDYFAIRGIPITTASFLYGT